jgi:hypothetical protein
MGVGEAVCKPQSALQKQSNKRGSVLSSLHSSTHASCDYKYSSILFTSVKLPKRLKMIL